MSGLRVLGAVGVMCVTVLLGGCGSAGSSLPTTSMSIKGEKFTLEIAAKEAERTHGLMERDAPGRNEGMIFIMDSPGIYPFWMHHVRFPLDIIWVSPEAKVVSIITMDAYDEQAQSNSVPARFIIELNGGRARELGLQVGDFVSLPEIVLKTAAATAEK